MEQLKKTPKPQEEEKTLYVLLDTYLEGNQIGSYSGIIEGNDILVMTTLRLENHDVEVLQLHLDDTEKLKDFIDGILYRKINLEPALGYNDHRIIKKFSADVLKKEVDSSTYQKISDSWDEIMSAVIKDALESDS